MWELQHNNGSKVQKETFTSSATTLQGGPQKTSYTWSYNYSPYKYRVK